MNVNNNRTLYGLLDGVSDDVRSKYLSIRQAPYVRHLAANVSSKKVANAPLT